MSDKLTLAKQYVEAYPQDAARALETLAAEPTSRLLETMSEKESTSLLGSMLPHYAAKCVRHLAPETAARFLNGLEPRIVANILRQLPLDARRAALAALSRRLAARVSIILNYATAMIGAWLEPAVMTLPEDCTVGEALERLKLEPEFNGHCVFVVDTENMLKGIVGLPTLIREPSNKPVANYLAPVNGTLRATTSLDMALEDTAWNQKDFMPVVDRRNRFIGVLRYAELRAAAARPVSTNVEQSLSGGFLDLAESCYLGLADVMNASLASDHSLTPPRGS